MKRPLCEVVKFTSPDGYVYTGLLYRSLQDTDKTIIHVHGMCGNMLSFSTLVDLADAYQKNGYNLLTFDLKAHDCIAEGVFLDEYDPKDEFYYVGGSIEPFEQRYKDIQSAIDFAHTFSKEIILQGHSMGCESIIAYQISSGNTYNTMLFSPCDAYKLQTNYIAPKTIDDLLGELEDYPNNVLLPNYFYGINTPTNTNIGKYTIPIYKKAMSSILSGLALKIFRQDNNLHYFLPINCLCVIGRNDPMQTYSAEHAFDLMSPKFNTYKGVLLDGDHELKPTQDELASHVLSWLRSLA